MKSRRIPTLSLILGLLFALPSPGAESLSTRQARKALKQADEALTAGRWSDALEHFGRVVEGLPKTHPRRAEALFGAAVAELSGPPARWDEARAGQYLEILSDTFPRHQRTPGARALAVMLETVESTRRQADTRSRELNRRLRQLERQARQRPVSKPDPDSQRLAEEVEQLKRQVAELNAELASTKDELAKKDEAIEKLKQVVLGSDG